MHVTVRAYEAADLGGCLGVFDSNVPRYFSAEERTEFATFLGTLPGPYLVAVDEAVAIVACGGYAISATGSADLCWGMVRADLHGAGLGRRLAEARIGRIRQDPAVREILLNTSQHTTGFYERLGFDVLSIRSDGYGPGLHRCEMRLALRSDR